LRSPIDSSESPPSKTQEKPKKDKKEKKDKGPPGKWPNPVKDWWTKLVDANLADLKKQYAQDNYKKLLGDFFKKSKHHQDLEEAIQKKQAAINYWGTSKEDREKLVKERDELKKELSKLEGELEKDFQKTDEGKKALTAKGDAEKAAADAHKAEQEAGKYIDKEALGEKAFEELEKSAAKQAEEDAKNKWVPAKW
jgi:hypothetical protein